MVGGTGRGPLDLCVLGRGGVGPVCAGSGDATREWVYRTVLGARLLDVMVPLLPGPAGVALDAGGEDGVLFPPMVGIVPDSVAVDLGGVG